MADTRGLCVRSKAACMTAFHDYWADILVAYGTFVLAALSPGPALLSTMGAAMSGGRKTGVMVALGVVCGSFTWGLLAAIGLSYVLATYANALTVVRIAGCAYLLFLAFKALRSAASSRELRANTKDRDRSAFASFVRGYAIHMTNPKGLFAWVAVISLGLKPGAPHWVAAAILGGTMVFALIYYTSAAVLFSTPAMVVGYGKARRWIDGVLGVFFIFAAWKLAAP